MPDYYILTTDDERAGPFPDLEWARAAALLLPPSAREGAVIEYEDRRGRVRRVPAVRQEQDERG